MLCKCSAFTWRVWLFAAGMCLLAAKVSAQVDGMESTDPIQLNNQELSAQDREEILAQIQTQLELLESSRDAYDIGISELSLELGAHFAELGYYDQSLEAYRRALHIARINYGLTSEQQLPILEQFLSLYEEAGYLAEVDQVFEKMLLIYQENYDPWSPAMASIYERIGNWHLAAYYYEIDQKPLSHLVAANIALSNARTIGRAQRDYSYDFNIYNLLAVTNWGLSTFYTSPNSSNDFTNDAGNFSRDASAHVHNAFRDGLSILNEGMEAAARTGDPEKMTRATLMYADWNQLFNRPRTARTHYLEAYSHSQKLPQDDPLRLSFSQPHALPNFDETEFSMRPRNIEHHEVELSFNVTEWGRPQSITPAETEDMEDMDTVEATAAGTEEPVADVESGVEVDSGVDTDMAETEIQIEETLSPEEIERQQVEAERTAISTIRNTKFRPAFINGQPADYENVKQTVLVAKES